MVESIEPSEPAHLTDSHRWATLQRSVEEKLVEEAFDVYRKHNLEPILIKGWASARNYPAEKIRSSSDIDLAFPAEDFERAIAIARANESGFLIFDIHREFKHLDNLPWNVIFERSQLVDLGSTKVRIPSPEDHLRLLCIHWLVDGGWFRERLWDIYYAVEQRPQDFDWSQCLGQVGENRRRWIISAIGLAHHYLDLKVDDLPFCEEAKAIPDWLIKAVECEWASGLRLMPLHAFVSEPSMFLRQIGKRLPPNPITATIDVEGSFDSKFRFHYQVGSILKRLGPSLNKFRLYFSK